MGDISPEWWASISRNAGRHDPGIRRDGGYLREGYFKFFHDSHRVLYRKTDDGILIVRVLHRKQQPENYL